MTSKQVDDGMNLFLVKNRIRLDKREMDIVLSGRDVVDNGVNKAIISDVCLINFIWLLILTFLLFFKFNKSCKKINFQFNNELVQNCFDKINLFFLF